MDLLAFQVLNIEMLGLLQIIEFSKNDHHKIVYRKLKRTRNFFVLFLSKYDYRVTSLSTS